MKAAVYMGGPDNIQIQDVPEPSIAEGEALIRIEACNICGVDLRTFNNGDKKITPPRILGHELSGSVVELKSNSVDLKVGDRVTMYVVIPCGVCSFCRKGRTNLCDNRTTMGYDHDGGFAEYMLVPRPALENKQLIRLPGHISFEAAALAEPLGTVINSHGHLNIGIKDTVVIIGAGPIGLLHSLI